MARVLVCTDERHIVRLVRVNLERQGHEVDSCATADRCLAKLRTGAFEALVVGSDMPDLIRLVENEFEGRIRVTALGSPNNPAT